MARPITATTCKNPSTSRHRAEGGKAAAGSESGEEAIASCCRPSEQEDIVRSPSARSSSRYYVGAVAACGILVCSSLPSLPAALPDLERGHSGFSSPVRERPIVPSQERCRALLIRVRPRRCRVELDTQAGSRGGK